jgi:hypothetical protein
LHLNWSVRNKSIMHRCVQLYCYVS